jgi:translation elongation factor EF-Tu-like GTPase
MNSGTFSLTITDVFAISHRGVVVTGRVAGAPVRINDRVLITGGGKVKEAVVSGLEVDKNTLDMAGVYDDAGFCSGM